MVISTQYLLLDNFLNSHYLCTRQCIKIERRIYILITLFQVKCIALKDIPSCSMQDLSQCPDVRSLTLQNCGLLAVEGLDKCKELQELHLQVVY